MKLILVMLSFSFSAFAQSGAPTGTLINPSVPNGVESNPTTFENVQPAIGSTPPPSKASKTPKAPKAKGANVVQEKTSFASPPETMQKETQAPEKKESH